MKKKLVFIGMLLLIVVYFGTKLFYLYYYDIDKATDSSFKEFKNGLVIKDTMTITRKDASSYINFKNIKVENKFKDFKLLGEQSKEDSIKYVLHDEAGNVKASFWISITDSYIDVFKNDVSLFNTYGRRISNKTLSNIIDKNNIKDDIELINYFNEVKDVENNIFTPIKKMKENFALQFMIAIIMPQIDSITLIDGDYKGFILNINNFGNIDNVYEARILYENKVYGFVFLSKDNYFTKDDINSILNSLQIG